MQKQTRDYLKANPGIKEMASLFIDNLTALDIYKAERFLQGIYKHNTERTTFIALRCYLEELEHNNRA